MIYEYIIRKYKSSWSYVINDMLRRNYDLSKQDREDVQTLNNALNTLPNYTGDVSRFLEFSTQQALDTFLEEHQVGKLVTYKGFTSTTVYGNTYNSEAQVILYILGATKGKDLTKYLPEEKEVLYPNNVSFLVKDMEVLNNTYHILLEEA